MNRREVLLGTGAALLSTQFASAKFRTAPPGGYHILPLLGLSNTVGAGLGLASQSDTAADLQIAQIGRHTVNNMQIIPFSERLEFWPFPSQAHAYGPSVGRYYAQTYLPSGKSLGIVPAAAAGSSVLEWNEVVTGNDPHLYTDMAARIAVFQAVSGSSVIGGLTELGAEDVLIIGNPSHPWHSLMPDVATFKAQMKTLINRFQSDYGGAPFIMSRFSTFWNPTYKSAVETALAEITTEIPNTRLISSAYSPANGFVSPGTGYVHLCAEGNEMQAMRYFLALSAQLTGAEYSQPNIIANGDFSAWSGGTSFSIPPNSQINTADGWSTYRVGAGNATISRQPGLNGFPYCMRIQRDAGTSDTQTIPCYIRVPDAIAASLAGQKITVAFDAAPGANFSGASGRFKVAICTAPGSGEAFDERTRSFVSATTISPNYLTTPIPVQSRYFSTLVVPADCGQMVIDLNWQPSGIAGLADYIDIGNVYPALGVVPLGLEP